MIKMDNIHGGSWKKLQNWATGLFLKKTADSDLNMNGNDISNAGNLYTQAQVNSTFMKKVADSDLNLNRYNLTGVNRLYSVGNSGKMVIVPNVTSADFGLTVSASIEDFFIEYLKYVFAQHTGSGQISFIGTFTKSGETYGEIKGTMMTSANYVDSNGVPTEYSFIATYMKSNVYFGVRDGANQQPALYNVSTFPFSDTTTDNRINAMGSSYIRYQNGLQICWGSVSREVPETGAWGNIFSAGISNAINFGVSFTSSPSISASVNDSSFTVGRVVRSAAAITGVELYRGSSASAVSVTFSYIAIGKWK